MIAPEAHIDGGTVFLPVNISEITMSVPDEVNEDGDVLSYKDVAGYAFDEYRINHPVGLPQEAITALMSTTLAWYLSVPKGEEATSEDYEEALGRFGV